MEAGIEAMMFITSPERWQAAYGRSEEELDDDNIEWVTPGTEEFKQMLADAVAAGHLRVD